MTKKDAKAKLDAIIDDGTSISKGDNVKILERASVNEITAYYGLCALIEACVREVARMIKPEDRANFIELLEKSDFELVSDLAKKGDVLWTFDDDFIVSADACMQKVLQVGNEMVVATELCATLHQIVLQYPTHGYARKTEKYIESFRMESVVNFVVKMAYAEILRLVSVLAESENVSVLEILYRWQELPVASEYFRRTILNYFNSSTLVVELPRQKEANMVRAAMASGIHFSTQIPLVTMALGAFDRITEVDGYDEDELDDSWNFVNYI